MPSLKRRIAETQVRLKKRQRAKDEKKLSRLQEQRNKALNQAKRSLSLAKAKEDAKDAALKRAEAKARLRRSGNQRGRKLANQLVAGGKKLFRDIHGKAEKKRTYRRKTAKR